MGKVHGSLACAGKVRGKLPRQQSKTRRRSPGAEPTSACNTTGASSPQLLNLGRSEDPTRRRMLAAWFRLKYPHITIGALASSAPILQFDDIIPWTSFYDAVSKDYKDASLKCFDVIKGNRDELETLSARNQTLVALSRTFRTCKCARSLMDFLQRLPSSPKCFQQQASNTISQGQKCFNIENATDAHGLSGWDWQACTEMVMPMSCSNESMFPPSTNYYKAFGEQCMRKYGIQPRAQIGSLLNLEALFTCTL